MWHVDAQGTGLQLRWPSTCKVVADQFHHQDESSLRTIWDCPQATQWRKNHNADIAVSVLSTCPAPSSAFTYDDLLGKQLSVAADHQQLAEAKTDK